jgi:site-specific DNA-methyltransferase (adenine-specific)
MDLNNLSRPELLEKCKELQLKSFSNKNKSELIQMIQGSSSETPSQTPKKTKRPQVGVLPKLEESNEIVETVEEKIPLNITLYNNDCIKQMKEIPDSSIDLILCDLPYGNTKCKWDIIIDIDELWKQYKRIIKKPSGVIVLFGQQPFTSRLIAGNYEWFKYNIIWKKNKTTQFLLANYRPMKCYEDIAVFSPGGAAAASRETGNMTYNPQGLISKVVNKVNSQKRIGKMLNQEHHLGKNNKLISNSEYQQKFTNYPKDIIEFDIESTTIHETQKPVALVEYLVRTYSNVGGVVLDNTMGSGTTGVACINSSRHFIGIELDKTYYELAKGRIDEHYATWYN